MNLLFKFLNSVNYFSCESSNFEFFVLSCIQENDDSVTPDGFILVNVLLNKLLFDNNVINFDVMFKDFYETFFFTFFQSFMVQLFNLFSNILKVFATFEFRAQSWEVRKSFILHVFSSLNFILNTSNINFLFNI